MNKLILLMCFSVCLLTMVMSEQTRFEFPTLECLTGIIGGNYMGCTTAVTRSIFKIHRWGKDNAITVCGNQCFGNLKGRFSKWQWKWDAKFHCSNKGRGILGQATALSRSGAMKHAIQDWIVKASQAGSIKLQDFKC